MTELVQNPPRGTSCSAREAARAESAARPWPKTRTPGGPQNGGVWAGSCQEGGHQGTLCPGRAGWDFSSLALEPTGAPSTHYPPPTASHLGAGAPPPHFLPHPIQRAGCPCPRAPKGHSLGCPPNHTPASPQDFPCLPCSTPWSHRLCCTTLSFHNTLKYT